MFLYGEFADVPAVHVAGWESSRFRLAIRKSLYGQGGAAEGIAGALLFAIMSMSPHVKASLRTHIVSRNLSP